MAAYIFAPHEFALPHTEESAVGILKSQAGLKGMEGFFHTDVDLLGMAAKLKASGFDTYITTKSGTAASAETQKKSVTELAKEVIAGKWGNGSDRKNRLTQAGYDYAAVQAKVNELMK